MPQKPPETAAKAPSGPEKKKAPPKVKKGWSFFDDSPPPQALKGDQLFIYKKHKNLLRHIRRQTYIIIILTSALFLTRPFFQPIMVYVGLAPQLHERRELPLVALTEPNLTDRAVLSWATASITEILTFGFGDLDARLIGQSSRFTEDGWISFVKSFFERDLQASFKGRQLVLTTVPADSPVITGRGADPDGDYVWNVQMPVVMTYATNNNVQSRVRKVVQLTIARVPAKKNIGGLGIKAWKMLG
ncbi:MAG: DotI/IcmL family type IV secretion protein [Alphaproteobacteria bacterium]|nr:DotI/IcmL family type IV secretion protein [Alphaproteobacteria bacterium]